MPNTSAIYNTQSLNLSTVSKDIFNRDNVQNTQNYVNTNHHKLQEEKKKY